LIKWISVELLFSQNPFDFLGTTEYLFPELDSLLLGLEHADPERYLQLAAKKEFLHGKRHRYTEAAARLTLARRCCLQYESLTSAPPSKLHADICHELGAHL